MAPELARIFAFFRPSRKTHARMDASSRQAASNGGGEAYGEVGDGAWSAARKSGSGARFPKSPSIGMQLCPTAEAINVEARESNHGKRDISKMAGRTRVPVDHHEEKPMMVGDRDLQRRAEGGGFRPRAILDHRVVPCCEELGLDWSELPGRRINGESSVEEKVTSRIVPDARRVCAVPVMNVLG